MAVAWTDITNAQVAAGAAVTTALMTALRDNPEGIAQRATGAPKIFGVPYDYQEFTSSGTWTKPSNAETGDKVLVQVVAGGAGGGPFSGGSGGAGAFQKFDDIDDLGATEAVVVGAGSAASGGVPASGGVSSFGTNGTLTYLLAQGGVDYAVSSSVGPPSVVAKNSSLGYGYPGPQSGGRGGSSGLTDAGGHSITGGGGGGSRDATAGGGPSMLAGGGGARAQNGDFPGGGGGASGGNGANGVVRVWCIKES